VKVEIEQKDEGGYIHTFVWLDDALSEREVKILFNSARRCEVGKLLGGPISLEYELKGIASLGHDKGVSLLNLKSIQGAQF